MWSPSHICTSFSLTVFYFCLKNEMGLLCSQIWLWIHHPPRCWYYRHVPPYLAQYFTFAYRVIIWELIEAVVPAKTCYSLLSECTQLVRKVILFREEMAESFLNGLWMVMSKSENHFLHISFSILLILHVAFQLLPIFITYLCWMNSVASEWLFQRKMLSFWHVFRLPTIFLCPANPFLFKQRIPKHCTLRTRNEENIDDISSSPAEWECAGEEPIHRFVWSQGCFRLNREEFTQTHVLFFFPSVQFSLLVWLVDCSHTWISGKGEKLER